MSTNTTIPARKPVDHLYQEWFLQYASYVILGRAVPHISDGLKPVQRRILHAMREMDDGRYNKVANIIGQSMQYHPHGDASIGDALVHLGQKDLLIDTQGNWGDIRTKDEAAAPRYIEARLSEFARQVLFNPKLTEWQLSYDGRKKEPIALPAKFPLLLAQGAEGIAVGLAVTVLPHNFCELIEASIAYLQHKPFTLYPDFQTGATIDVSEYRDGRQGGKVKCRATIEEKDAKTLIIRDVPYGISTRDLCESIVKANEKGNIKIKKVNDNTAEQVEIQVDLLPGVSTGQTMEALYLFTKCEISIHTNACVIDADGKKPLFLSVSDLLAHATEQTQTLLKRELDIQLREWQEKWHRGLLEKIFIEQKIYTQIEDQNSWEGVLLAIERGLAPFQNLFARAISPDDILALTEIKIKRISKFDIDKANDSLAGIEKNIAETQHHLAHLTQFCIAYYKNLLRTFGKTRRRKSKIQTFASIDAKTVAVANEKYYVNRQDGFIGTGLKKDEFVANCSARDDVIVFRQDGTMLVTRVSEKAFVGKNIIHTDIFTPRDDRIVYHLIYRAANGVCYVKKFTVGAITRGKEYPLFVQEKNAKLLYFSVNRNGENEHVGVVLSPNCSARNKKFSFDFASVGQKNRAALGVQLTKYPVHKIVLQTKIASAPDSRHIFYDEQTCRLTQRPTQQSRDLGVFSDTDAVLAVFSDGTCALFHPDYEQRIDAGNLVFLQKFSPDRLLTIIYESADKDAYFAKRIVLAPNLVRNEKMSFLRQGVETVSLVSVAQNPVLQIERAGSAVQSVRLGVISCVQLSSAARSVGLRVCERQKIQMHWSEKNLA